MMSPTASGSPTRSDLIGGEVYVNMSPEEFNTHGRGSLIPGPLHLRRNAMDDVPNGVRKPDPVRSDRRGGVRQHVAGRIQHARERESDPRPPTFAEERDG